MSDTHTLEGKRLLITGAGSGIGRALAVAASSAGAVLSLADVDGARLAEVAELTGGAPAVFDVGDEAAWRLLAEAEGPWDHVALNAGIMSVPPDADPGLADLFKLDFAAYRRVMSVNVDGVVLGMRATIPGMRAAGGSVVVTASAAGIVGLGYDPAYSVSKHAVIGLVRSVAARLQAANTKHPERAVRICAVAPGSVRTAMFPTIWGEDVPALAPEAVATEIVDLLLRGDNGEVRALIQPGLAPQRVDAAQLIGWY